MDRVRNEEVRRRAGIERELASRADQRVLRFEMDQRVWFGHVERMDKYRMVRRVLMAEVSGGRVRGRPRLGWMDGVNWPFATEKWRWRLRVNARKIGKSGESCYICNWMSFSRPFLLGPVLFCLALCSFACSFAWPSRALVVITGRGVGCRYMTRLG